VQFAVSNTSYTWITIKHQDRLFDVRLNNSRAIEEIRTVDSEINIAPILNEKIIYSVQSIANKQKFNLKELAMQYKDLRQINVSQHIEKKNGLSYLSWSWAVDQLLQLDGEASWEYLEPKAFGDTLMVFCKVTAFGKSRTAQLPVMDFRNQAIPNPNAYQVNTAMQRCLAKAISLHGIGLYIYAGEDLPILEHDANSKQSALIENKELQAWIDQGEFKSLHEYFEKLSQAEKVSLWHAFNSETKKALEKYRKLIHQKKN
jgi:hypothetical protein